MDFKFLIQFFKSNIASVVASPGRVVHLLIVNMTDAEFDP